MTVDEKTNSMDQRDTTKLTAELKENLAAQNKASLKPTSENDRSSSLNGLQATQTLLNNTERNKKSENSMVTSDKRNDKRKRS